ncbi:hypothetical protein DRQ11_14700, partial [candidate division KSB1 bacterium]
YIVDNETTSPTERIILKDDTGTIIEEFAVPGGLGPAPPLPIAHDFRGYSSTIPIAEVHIIEANDGEGALLDNLMYTVLEPACVATDYEFVTKWGSYGTGDGQFISPRDIAFDSEGNVYITDNDNNRVQKFTSDGTFITKWPCNDPMGIAVDASGYVYVADNAEGEGNTEGKIWKFKQDGGSYTPVAGWQIDVIHPLGIALDVSGNIYVCAEGANLVKKFSDDTSYITSLDGRFNAPVYLQVDSDGIVYVADHYNDSIKKFTSTDGINYTYEVLCSTNDPGGVAVDVSGYVYVTGYSDNWVKKFTPGGQLVTSWGESGLGDGQFTNPIGVEINSLGHVYVADHGAHRIQKFAPICEPACDFSDDFEGTALDKSKWCIVIDALGQGQWPYVADGLLHSQGYHTRIDSIPTFAAPETGQSVMARARIKLSGEVNKFGFAPNPNERTGPITGYYFDTVDSSVGGGLEHHVRALAWSNPGSVSMINLLDVEIPVTWYEFHEFAIERTPSEVIYSIDGQEVARVADAFVGALPVGVWNDRWSLMQTDWVEVCSVELEPAGPCWSEQAKLLASDGAAGDEFGRTIAIDGDYAIVGAVYDDNRAGSAYIFKRVGEDWIEQDILRASDRQAGDWFGGWSVSIRGDYAAIGAVGKDSYTGSAYIFKRIGESWVEQAILTASDGIPGDQFGNGISVNGDYLIVTAPYANNSTGAAYIFKREGEIWTQQQILTAS